MYVQVKWNNIVMKRLRDTGIYVQVNVKMLYKSQ